MPDQNEMNGPEKMEEMEGMHEMHEIDVAETIAEIAKRDKLKGSLEDLEKLKTELSEEVPQVVSPDMLLAEIVKHIGPDFVVIPMKGWGSIVKVIQDYKDEQLLDDMENLKVPVVPVSLTPKDEESRIILPTDAPKGESKIIV